MSARAVLWDADGVLQSTPAGTWDLAVRVIAQFPNALIGAPIDEHSIRAVTGCLGLGDRAEDILAVWSTFEVLNPILDVVSLVREAGTACYLASNQDAHRAACMRKTTPYEEMLDGSYYSCDIGVAKPAEAFFEHIVTDLGLAPAQVLFLDDQPRNVAGARAAGLNAEQWTYDDGVAQLRDILDAHGVRWAADEVGHQWPVSEDGLVSTPRSTRWDKSTPEQDPLTEAGHSDRVPYRTPRGTVPAISARSPDRLHQSPVGVRLAELPRTILELICRMVSYWGAGVRGTGKRRQAGGRRPSS